MDASTVFYRKNKTDECFYRVMPDRNSVEVVLAFHDSYKSIKQIRCNQLFIEELMDELETIDQYTYECVKNYVKCMTALRKHDSEAYRPSGSHN